MNEIISNIVCSIISHNIGSYNIRYNNVALYRVRYEVLPVQMRNLYFIKCTHTHSQTLIHLLAYSFTHLYTHTYISLLSKIKVKQNLEAFGNFYIFFTYLKLRNTGPARSVVGRELNQKQEKQRAFYLSYYLFIWRTYTLRRETYS